MHNTEKLINKAFDSVRKEFINVRRNHGNEWKHKERLNDFEFGISDENYDEYLNNNKKINNIPSLVDINDEIHIIHELLSYIKMSPSKVYEHEKTYVIDKSKYFQLNIEKYLVNPDDQFNRNDVFVKQILKYWIEKSHDLANYNELNYGHKLKALRLTTYYLLGQPGVGKTALLNYLFSIGANELRSNNIIWLRIDLNDPSDIGLALEERLFLKFLKIYCRFYYHEDKRLSDSKYIDDLSNYLFEYAKKYKYFGIAEDNIVRFHVNDYMSMINDYVPRAKNDLKISLEEILKGRSIDDNIFKLFTGSLMTFLQRKIGLGYIIIFDGLDSVTLDKVQYETYCEWLNEFATVCDNTKIDYFKSIYIVSMRDYSFVQFYIKVLKENKRSKEEYSILKVKQKDFYKILTSRFDLIVEILNDAGFKTKKSELWNIKNNLIDIVNSCLYGLAVSDFSEKYIENESVKREQYDLITNLCSGNLRAVMRLFRYIIVTLGSIWGDKCFEYLASHTGYKGCLKHIEGKEWAIYRVLIFGDPGGNAYRCKISYDFGGNANIKHRNTALVPNIFNYKETGMQDAESRFPRNLLKLRVIQYLRQTGGCGNIVNIIEELKNIYICDPKTLRADIREMIYDGLLNPHKVEQTDFIRYEKNYSDYPVKLTPLSYHIADNIIKESIYYEIICDDTPIDLKYARNMQPLNKYDKNTNLGDYLIIKTYSIFFFILYLQKIENNEKLLLDNNKCIYWNKTIFDDNTIRMVTSDVANYIHKYLRTTKNESEKNMFLNNWERNFGS